MIVFVGAGPGAEDLITVRGQQYLKRSGHYHLCRVTGKSGSFAGKKKKAVKYITAPI